MCTVIFRYILTTWSNFWRSVYWSSYIKRVFVWSPLHQIQFMNRPLTDYTVYGVAIYRPCTVVHWPSPPAVYGPYRPHRSTNRFTPRAGWLLKSENIESTLVEMQFTDRQRIKVFTDRADCKTVLTDRIRSSVLDNPLISSPVLIFSSIIDP